MVPPDPPLLQYISHTGSSDRVKAKFIVGRRGGVIGSNIVAGHERGLGHYTILQRTILYGVWRENGGSEGGSTIAQ